MVLFVSPATAVLSPGVPPLSTSEIYFLWSGVRRCGGEDAAVVTRLHVFVRVHSARACPRRADLPPGQEI